MKLTKSFIQKIYKPISAKAHKGTQGHALIIGGSYGKMGSICLSTKAALHSGCGLATAFIPKCGYDILQISIPEAMVITDKEDKYISKISFSIEPKAIGIGPGMGQADETQMAFRKFLKNNTVPLVIDADGLNMLSENDEWLELLQPQTILTPHYKELERLLDGWDSDEDMLQKAVAFSKQHQVIVVMKGAPTQIIDGDNIYENTTGNPALATAGSGDVLTGIITGLLAQSYEPIHAAQLGVYLHGLTADIALPHTGHESFVASDIIHLLGKAFLTLQGYRNEIGFK
ncbi:NAD(P)H-hydrate dehydratase [Flavobacterium sp.]|uniref:NAD(P)H-hydrate dehydratase n=1 Tax=Flavobacterium sp. TaxID=239 RepID=UPI0039E360E8